MCLHGIYSKNSTDPNDAGWDPKKKETTSNVHRHHVDAEGMGYFLSAGEICLCLFAFANINSSHFKQ